MVPQGISFASSLGAEKTSQVFNSHCNLSVSLCVDVLISECSVSMELKLVQSHIS